MIYAIIFICIIFLGAVLSRLSASLLVNYFEKTNKIMANCNLTSFELMVFFIQQLNLKIKVTKFSTYLDNSYNINKKLIVLSEDVFDNKSVGALAISMHELGHAVQHKNKSFLFYLNYVLIFLNKLTGVLLLPLLIFLVVSMFLPLYYFNIALILLAVFYAINLLARIIIIPLEGNASKLAIKLLKNYNIFSNTELKQASKLLGYAKLTYVGGFFNIYIKFFKKIIKGF